MFSCLYRCVAASTLAFLIANLFNVIPDFVLILIDRCKNIYLKSRTIALLRLMLGIRPQLMTMSLI